MESEKQVLKDKGNEYGFKALSDKELLQVAGFRGNQDEFYNTSAYRAMKELVRRKQVVELKQIKCSNDAFNHLSFLEDMDKEQFWAMFSNRSNRVQKVKFISQGDVSETVCDIKEILKTAINLKSSSIILCHNHPSGNRTPSPADLSLTKKMKGAAALIGKLLSTSLFVVVANTIASQTRGLYEFPFSFRN
jgi:DNA repair protein RadC